MIWLILFLAVTVYYFFMSDSDEKKPSSDLVGSLDPKPKEDTSPPSITISPPTITSIRLAKAETNVKPDERGNDDIDTVDSMVTPQAKTSSSSDDRIIEEYTEPENTIPMLNSIDKEPFTEVTTIVPIHESPKTTIEELTDTNNDPQNGIDKLLCDDTDTCNPIDKL